VDRGCLEAGGGGLAPDEEEERIESLTVYGPRSLPGRWGEVQRLARRVSGEWLPRQAVLEAVTAEVLSAIRLEVDPEPIAPALRTVRQGDDERITQATEPASGCAAPAVPAGARPEAPAFLASLTEGLEEAGALELDCRLRRAVALEQGLLARMGPLLAALARGRLYRDLGFRSLEGYVRERPGFSLRTARALLRLERACLVSAPLREAWRSGRLSWCQAQALAGLAELAHAGPWMAAWVERAGRVTLRRLEDDLEHALATGELDPAALPAYPAGVQIGASPIGPKASVPTRLGGPASVVRLFRATLATVQRRIERAEGRASSRAEALTVMIDHVEDAWGKHRRVPRKYAVLARDGWRCAAPGCTSYRNLHAHHVEFRSAGGGDEPENLVTLCAWHHQRGVHSGVLRIRGRAPGALRFELPFGAYASGDVWLTPE
jgi:hypothetical protein